MCSSDLKRLIDYLEESKKLGKRKDKTDSVEVIDEENMPTTEIIQKMKSNHRRQRVYSKKDFFFKFMFFFR